MPATHTTAYSRFLTPRYWLNWIVYLILWLITRLPFSATISIGRLFGRVLYWLPSSAKKVAYANIKQCFPELSILEQKKLVKKHFESLGMGIIEMFLCWWSKDKFKNRISWHGIDNLINAQQNKKSIILLTCHFTTLEIGGTLINNHLPVAAMYREQSNLFFNEIMNRSRTKNLDRIIDRNNIRDLCRYLKNRGIVWYAPDQNYNGKQSVYADFFGLPAATTSATSRLAQMTNAIIIPFYQIRNKDNKGYTIYIDEPLKNIPSGDLQLDTEIINKTIENIVRKAPEQYLWSHRRFKNLPKHINPIYS